jgi:hypothetical protein
MLTLNTLPLGAWFPCGTFRLTREEIVAFAERYEIPLPLWHYVGGAGAAVALSFVVMALVLRKGQPPRSAKRIAVPDGLWRGTRILLQACGLLLFALLIAAGSFGPQGDWDSNPLPVAVWVIWWVGIAFLCALLGDIWSPLDPWRTVGLWLLTLLTVAGLGRAGRAMEQDRHDTDGTPALAVIDLPRHGSLTGRLLDLPAEATGKLTTLVWQSPAFARPFEFALDGVIGISTRFVMSGALRDADADRRAVKLPVEIAISDNGPGVPDHIVDELFSPFVTTKRDGQGLGLAIVRKLVQQMNSRVLFERDSAQGQTIFRLLLPVASGKVNV